MTFKEKLQIEHPNCVDEKYDGGCYRCPDTYDYEKKSHCKGWSCAECWNREIPTTKSEETPTQATDEEKPFTWEEFEIGKQGYSKGYSVGKTDGYELGLAECWELCKRIYLLDDRTKVFGMHEYMECIFENFTPQEAIELMQVYAEQSKIRVGDIVANDKEQIKGLVLDIDNADPCVWVLTENECVEEWDFCDIKKTDKHVDLEPIMKFVREK